MANNCLVTKLKGVVDNNNLPKIDEVYFGVTIESELQAFSQVASVVRVSNGTFDVYDHDGNLLESGVSSYTYTPYTWRTFKNFSSDCTIFIDKKDRIESFAFDNSVYIPNGMLKYTMNIELRFIGYNDMPNAVYLRDLNLSTNTITFQSYPHNVYGNVAELGNSRINNFICSTNITGDLIPFVVAQIKSGRTSATIMGDSWQSLTFNSEAIPATSDVSFSWSPSGSNYSVSITATGFSRNVIIDASGNIIN